jgi:flavodoxin
MKALLYYAAPTPTGASARVAAKLMERLSPGVTAKNIITDKATPDELEAHELVLLITATYGDQELHDNMEELLIAIAKGIEGKRYIICEIGNYYGYDDYTFGAARIIDSCLKASGGIRSMKFASIDSLPKLDLVAMDKWVEQVKNTFDK